MRESRRNRRDLSSVSNNQDNEFDNNRLTNLDIITVNRNPNSDKELLNTGYLDDELDKNTFITFNQTLQNYLKKSVGNDTFNFTKIDKIHLTDTTVMKAGNTVVYVLPYWKIVCNDKKYSG